MSPSEQLAEVVQEWSEVFMRRSMHDFKCFMDESGLSFSQVSILMHLYHGGKRGVSEMGDHMGVTNAAASQAVDRLVQLDMIKREEDPADRRAKQLALTEKGRIQVQNGIEVRSKWVESLTDTLTLEQQSTIVSMLKLLTEAARKVED
jgi:DNA-binding MarR family transcriptional regulator